MRTSRTSASQSFSAAREGLTDGWVGTTDYLAPEVIDGVEASARSDVYALTAVLYECVVGHGAVRRPRRRREARRARQRPRRRRRRPRAPRPALDAVIAKGMAKAPGDRYATASDLARAAARALGFEDRGPQLKHVDPPRPTPDDTATEATG